ncbi:MAG: hypothetical protein GYA47_13780, partial [Desulfovibrio sp.]|nr:hypothetical protein [Desulfovibrio sp.]
MKRVFILAAAMGLLLAAQAGLAGNKQLMSEKMAEQDLKRNIVEAIIGYKVKSESRMGLTEDPSYKAETKAAAVVKGIKVDKMIYDKEKDIALCFGHIDLGDVVNVVGDLVRFKGVTVEGFGFGTMTEAAKPPLMALRAALLDAYNQMAALLVGEKILSQSTMENFILTKDVNRAKVCAAIFGAYIPNPGLNSPNRGWGWDESGNAFVKLELDPRKVQDILGNLIVYKGPNVIEVTGRGSQTDELSGDTPGSMVRD